MRRPIIFVLTIFWACSDPTPDKANKFVGTYICEQETPDRFVTTEWKIWKDHYKDRIRIDISITDDFKQAGMQDSLRHFSVDSVLVESESELYFNNPYVGEGAGTRIKGRAIKSEQKLAADIAIINANGASRSQRLDFTKKPFS